MRIGNGGQFIIWCFWVVAFASCASLSSAQQPNDSDWRPLFNGHNLDGWALVNTPPDTWTFEDGVLVCSGKPIGEIRTTRMFQNFEMEIEWRHMKPAGNAGIFVWADDITARGVPFHRGIEVQVLENAYGNTDNYSTHGDIFPIHGAEMTPVNGRGGKRAFPTQERSLPSPQWNHYRITCRDGDISLAVNGELVTQGKNAKPRKGYICIESEGGIVQYRNARIREFPSTPLNESLVAVADRGFKSLYSGLDLRGWKTTAAGRASWHPNDWVLVFDGSVPTQDAALISEDDYALRGFIVDFRFNDKSESLALELPDASKPMIFSTRAESPYAVLLETRGSWNRVEGRVQDGVVLLLINGQEIKTNVTVGKGKIAIHPIGAIELANIYVR